MEKHRAEQEQANAIPASIVVLIPSRGRPDMLKMTVMALDHLASEINKITYCIAVDNDDVATCVVAQELARNGNVQIMMGERPEGIGRLYNDLAKANPADVYMPFADDIIPLVQNWDILVAKGSEQFPVFAWHDHFNGHFPSYPIISRAWYEAAGKIFCEKYPFWLNDTELNEVVAMVTGKNIPIATDLPLGGRRGKTHRMADLGVWFDLFRLTRDERQDEAGAIREKLGFPAPPLGSMALNFEKQDIYLASNIDRFQHIFGDGEPATPEYARALDGAKARIAVG